VPANCIAVSAVVASSTRRRFVMMVWIPGEFLATTSDDQQICVRPDCGGPQRRTWIYFRMRSVSIRPCSSRIQTIVSDPNITLSAAGHPVGLDRDSRSGKSAIPASVAEEGVPGRCGPRTGSSSGVRPGSSSGRGDSPGSWIGVGTSGRGLPGGSSCGGWVGLPGVGGGISGGSIGISPFPESLSPRQRPQSGNVPSRTTYARSNSVLLRVLPASM
jgi:hypothetical protein